MTYLTFNYEKALPFLKENTLHSLENNVKKAHVALHQKTGLGNDYLGWLDLPDTYDKVEFAKIKQCANKIKENSDILLVIGIGGSYLGARAAIDMLTHSFQNNHIYV